MDTDLVIVGAGPIGIELAAAVKREKLRYHHFEARQIAATIAWYAPATRFFSSPERISICGVPLQTVDQSKATREEYLTYLRSVVQQFDLAIHSYEPVVHADRLEDGTFRLVTRPAAGERTTLARRVVLAIGDMHRPRRLGVPGEDLPTVSHYLDDPHRYFRRRVVIVGGKNSAVEAAIRCARVGAEVTLSYRGEELAANRIKYWLLPEIRAMIRDGRIRFLPSTRPVEILPDRIRLAVGDPEAAKPAQEIPADFVLLLTGYEQDPTLFRLFGVELEGPGGKPRHDEATMETNVPGVYVAGTAAAGTQLTGVKAFIETSHVHVDRIVAALTGRPVPEAAPPQYELPES
jgi:thioredoxin reductase (NADPH)